MGYRILHIIPTLNKGGAERLVLDICQALVADSENSVLLISFSEKNAYGNLYPEVPIKYVPASVNLSVSGTNTYNVDALQKEIELFAPDIIHTHLFEAEIISRSCIYPKAKWFSHGHSNMPAFKGFSLETLGSKLAFTRFYEKKYLFGRYQKNGGNSFIAISNSTKQYFEKNVKPFPVHLLPNAINYNRFYQEKTPSVTHKISLVNVGSLGQNKNQTFLLDVAQILSDKGIEFELHLLGDGVLKTELMAKIERLELTKSVFMHGSVDRVEDYLHKSDMYVHSAKSEALGLTLLEAMAAGLPVVTLDGKGNRDLIEEGKNGYMIFEPNASLFADKIMAIWNDRNHYRQLSHFAQEYALRYDIKPYIQHLLSLYKSSLMN